MSQSTLSRYLNQAGLTEHEHIQSLWSGYGEIARYSNPRNNTSMVIKKVELPQQVFHPRGWNTQTSHLRKLKSYQVERAFYQYIAPLLDQHCRVARMHECIGELPSMALLLEDLDASGYVVRRMDDNIDAITLCLRWLAFFHAKGLALIERQSIFSNQLWPIGCYWHLATRQDELQAMESGLLHQSAVAIDNALNTARYQTIVHGDAKIANFCFHVNGQQVAAVDFQYPGLGVGVKDVMYFFTSCLDERGLQQHHNDLLDQYFEDLQLAMAHYQLDIDGVQVEREWRDLYDLCWADFHRFLAGWSPQHTKLNRFMLNKTEQALKYFKGSELLKFQQL
ncbi:oxidoreductase family protein [Thalassotalea sp. Y01]|uniref:oxidoreductase family protein n=1 Tax=Thalassotalea sp. Y01 TaxID=2729613 RepID=UPI00145EB152|nr:oxidoreductase family protein [Thalassotalea sp. Y01]NMP14954.1 DUF1679 domain-containing protein [Thalassotalea sp. Y01]